MYLVRVLCRTTAVLLALMLLQAAPLRAQDRPAQDRQLPEFPVDAAACKQFLVNGDGAFSYNPFAIQGVFPKPGMQISSLMVPNTPVFRFYANYYSTFSTYSIAFAPGMRCFRQGTYDASKGLVYYSGLPAGEYIHFVTVSYPESSSGVSHHSSTAYDPYSGAPITVDTTTPYSSTYDHRRVYGSAVSVGVKTVDGRKVTSVSGGKEYEISGFGHD